jgi:two-component system chemotaxis sensor kinase CheA
MDLAGQLVINKAQFTQIGDKLKTALSGRQSVNALNTLSSELEKIGGDNMLRLDGKHTAAQLERVYGQVRRIQNSLEPIRRQIQILGDARNSVGQLFEAIHQLGRLSDGIQQSVMDTRMVPIGPLFGRFKRVIRDITRANGKDLVLVINGDKTELDKRMIDELGDPLVHMVRNSADHGIELPDERERAGKPRQGTVTLDAFHRGNSIVIEVRDDGKGLDGDRILKKCLEKGLLNKADAEKMTPQQIYQMIWEPGLSTAEKVTQVSGRGMGMDIVKSKIEELNGTVEVESTPGVGTTISIKLPLTLAILPSLLVDIGGDVFAMPLETVSEIVTVSDDQLSTVQGQQMATVRGRVVSLVRLGDVLSFHGPGNAAEASRSRDTTLVIVGEMGQEIGIAVDEVIGEEDIVIKSIAENYENISGIAGASILGDGRVSLILDVSSLIEKVSRKSATVTC